MVHFTSFSILALALLAASVPVQADGYHRCHPTSGSGTAPTVAATAVFQPGQYSLGSGLDGAGVDAQGALFVAHNGLADPSHTITKLTNIDQPSIFFTAPSQLTGAFGDVRFQTVKTGTGNQTQQLYITDLKTPRVFALPAASTSVQPDPNQFRVFCQDAQMMAPYGISVSRQGNVYIVGQKVVSTTKVGDGDLWLCNSQGHPTRLDTLTRPNGVDATYQGDTLYVAESTLTNGAVSGAKVWRYQLDPATGHVVVDSATKAPVKTVLVDFEALDKTGSTPSYALVTDVNNNVFVSRNALNKVVKLSPQGQVLATITVPTGTISSMALGGADGKTLYILGTCAGSTTNGCVYSWTNDAAGSAWQMQQ
ncbi:hypothetical protein IWQ60_009622 [Tieghemiomyces parasiticus]|uniref:SMP-30/Gluconolactonase/LRE-like region domain-containing protein n=1 Tax=Tieghemiomyces parasiticus TaxID=78921 RepID=A0A9W7ZX29_9FUNG|nr:hypothetical protein IWQ60_009622 [Tieghemiomyces parasiticus]